MAEQLTDQALVERVQQGDKKAFNLLVSRYQNKVAGLLTRYISHNDIPDVVQESFIIDIAMCRMHYRPERIQWNDRP